ncbi:MAG TPA: hypothetical protein VEJ63_06470 [Planctomycetota bacterium]|nr:hypothetical protein [Planctomycetota bacterium]
MHVYEAIAKLNSVVWFSVFRRGVEIRRTRDSVLQDGDIIVAGLEAETRVRAWQVAGAELRPLERRGTDHLIGRNTPPRRWTDSRSGDKPFPLTCVSLVPLENQTSR